MAVDKPDSITTAVATANESDHDIVLPETKLSRWIDGFIRWIGNMCSWVWVVLVAVIITNVVLRYVFQQGRIEFEELQWHLYAFGWLIGLSYCFAADDHVRVDLVHDRLSPLAKAWVELWGMSLLLLPFISIVLIYSLPFVWYAWEVQEISDAPGGLPYRWAIKAMLTVGFILWLLAFIARFSRVCCLLYRHYEVKAVAGGKPSGDK